MIFIYNITEIVAQMTVILKILKNPYFINLYI